MIHKYKVVFREQNKVRMTYAYTQDIEMWICNVKARRNFDVLKYERV